MNPAGSADSLNGNLLVVQPDVVFVSNSFADTSVPPVDLISKWAFCYGMWSGGVRLKDVLNTSLTAIKEGTIKATTFARNHSDLGTLANCLTTFNGVFIRVSDSAHSVLQQYTNNNSAIELEIPQYTTTIARSVQDCVFYGDGDITSRQPRLDSMTQLFVHVSGPSNVTITGASENTHYHNLYRAGSDDMNLSVFISIPPFSKSVNLIPNNQYSL
jgi:hypothetical protein